MAAMMNPLTAQQPTRNALTSHITRGGGRLVVSSQLDSCFVLGKEKCAPAVHQGASGNMPLVVAAKCTKKNKSSQTIPSAPIVTAPDVSVTETQEPNSRVRLTVTVPNDTCKRAWDQAIRDISKSIQIDGFRKGDRVPEYLLVRHVGEENIKQQVVEGLLHSTLPDALDSVAGRALKDSEHITTKAEELVSAFSVDSPFQYDVTVDVVPEVKWVTDRAYASLKVEVPVEDESDLSAEIEKLIRSRHKDLGSLKISESSSLKMGDVAVVDVSSFRIKEDNSNGEPIYSAAQKGFQIDTEEGVQSLLPGLVEALLGIQRTQTWTFDLPFPATWQQESLRGVTGRFQVQCNEIFERNLPPLDDSTAGTFIPGAKTMDEVRERLGASLMMEREQKKKQATMLALVEAVGEVCDMEVPNSLLEEQGRQMYGAKLIELQADGRLPKDGMAQLMTEQMVNNYLVAQKDKIERQVKQALGVQEIYRLEGLSYSEEELATECNNAIAEFKAYGQEYDEARVREQAAELLEGGKVLEWLTKNATVVFVPKEG